MDKLAVNQQIVLMRKKTKAAKRRTVLILANEVKALREKIAKASEAANSKVEDKLNRKLKNKLAEREAAQKCNLDIVSKAALEKFTPWKEVIECSSSSLETRVVAKIANVPIVQKSVAEFRLQNPNSELWIKPLLDMWDEKKKIRKGKRVDPSEPTDKQNSVATRLKPAHIDSDKTERSVAKAPKAKLPIPNNIKPTATHSFVVTPMRNIKAKEPALQAATLEVPKPKTGMVVQKLSLSEGKYKADTVSHASHKQEMDTLVKPTKRDKFFLSNDGEEYSSEEVEEEEEPVEKAAFTKPRPQSRPNNKRDSSHNNRHDQNIKQNNRGAKHFESANNIALGKRNKTNVKPYVPDKANQSSGGHSEKLHPSWEAKRNQRAVPLISDVKGTHIKFTD